MNAYLSVIHKMETGWHTFTSPQLPGLFLTGSSEQLEELRQALPIAINALVEADTGRRIWLEEVQSLQIYESDPGSSEVLHFMATDLIPKSSVDQANPW